MALHNTIGKSGEKLAQEYLTELGYIIRDTNWRIRHYEIDIVCEKDNILIIVEVKSRSNNIEILSDLLNTKKQKFLIRAANAYINKYKLDKEVRFDLILTNPSNNTIQHIQEAIQVF